MHPASRTHSHTSLGLPRSKHLDGGHAHSTTSSHTCLPIHYPRVQTPLVPSKTPTFRRVSKKSRQLFGRSTRESNRPQSVSGVISHRKEGVTHQILEGESAERRKRINGDFPLKDDNASRPHSQMLKSELIFRREDTGMVDGVQDTQITRHSGCDMGIRQYWNDGIGTRVGRLPQSLRQSYTCSPSLYQDDELQSTGMHMYHAHIHVTRASIYTCTCS